MRYISKTAAQTRRLVLTKTDIQMYTGNYWKRCEVLLDIQRTKLDIEYIQMSIYYYDGYSLGY